MASIYYENPKRNNRSIRVLTLLPGSWSTRIEAELRQVSLNDGPLYEAVSYTRGNADDTASVWVEGVELLVPRNLETCLRYLRKDDVAIHIWVDSICISQRLIEKECQIAMMGEIFRRYASVFYGTSRCKWRGRRA
ncbi:heterokaryon incompatibility protein-domain-containing protein [Pyrenochaeta sp. MPI-SDFR-AT-0127]|nr:heterokaryon incompatibility protein-domain-containing protein [Pyrenochaeta sp. MPI-SDFR-AT-0127]